MILTHCSFAPRPNELYYKPSQEEEFLTHCSFAPPRPNDFVSQNQSRRRIL